MDDGKNEPLEIFIGKNPVIASMAQKVGSLVVNKEAYQKFSFEFIAQDNGIAYIGIQNKVSLNILGHSLSIAVRLLKIYRGVFVTAKLEIHRISINMRTAQIVQKRIQIVKISILDC